MKLEECEKRFDRQYKEIEFPQKIDDYWAKDIDQKEFSITDLLSDDSRQAKDGPKTVQEFSVS